MNYSAIERAHHRAGFGQQSFCVLLHTRYTLTGRCVRLLIRAPLTHQGKEITGDTPLAEFPQEVGPSKSRYADIRRSKIAWCDWGIALTSWTATIDISTVRRRPVFSGASRPLLAIFYWFWSHTGGQPRDKIARSPMGACYDRAYTTSFIHFLFRGYLLP